MDIEIIARELVRALRGSRSQLGLSRRLGFSTNVLYTWESGKSAPAATLFLAMAERCGLDTREAFRGFYVKAPSWLSSLKEFPSRAGVAAFLRNQRGATSLVSLAEESGISRFALSRWLKGTAEPRLPELLRVIHHTTQRLADWIALFVDPGSLPSLKAEWQRHQAARAAAEEEPWTQAVVRGLELVDYLRLAEHKSGWLASRLGISEKAESRALALLASSGQIAWQGAHWEVQTRGPVNLRKDPTAARAQRAFWAGVAAERAGRDPGMFAYNLCSISRSDLERLKRMQRDFLQAARGVIAESEPAECVALLQTQIFALDQDEASQSVQKAAVEGNAAGALPLAVALSRTGAGTSQRLTRER